MKPLPTYLIHHHAAQDAGQFTPYRETMKTLVIPPRGKAREVKNLGWLLRHASEVSHVTLSNRDDGARCGCKLTADLNDGTKYETRFNSLSIAREWIKRPSLRHAFHADHVTLASDRNP